MACFPQWSRSLIVNERIVCEKNQQSLEIEAVGSFDVGRHQRRKGGQWDMRMRGREHDEPSRSWNADGRFATTIADRRRPGALYVVKN
jgi:hypothetical protein